MSDGMNENRNDFLAAVEVEVIRWQFAELVRREFASGEVPTRLAASPDAST